MAGRASGIGRAPGGRLPVRPRSRSGSRLFVDPRGAARRGAPSDREAARGAHPSRDEREQLAQLNLLAGKRAKASTAYASALTYLVTGATLLPEDSWECRHELTFELERLRAECEFVTGAMATADERLKRLSTRAANTVERASVACL